MLAVAISMGMLIVGANRSAPRSFVETARQNLTEKRKILEDLDRKAAIMEAQSKAIQKRIEETDKRVAESLARRMAEEVAKKRIDEAKKRETERKP